MERPHDDPALARRRGRAGPRRGPAGNQPGGDEISRKARVELLTLEEIIYELCMDAVEGRMPLRRLLLEDPRVKPYLGETDLDTLLNPTRYTGLAARFVDRVAPP